MHESQLPGFIAVVLAPHSVGRVRALATFPIVCGDYQTIWYKPTHAERRALSKHEGGTVILQPIGIITDGEKVQVLLCAPTPGIQGNRVPHVTISLAKGVDRRYSNELIARYQAGELQLEPCPSLTELDGVVEFVRFPSTPPANEGAKLPVRLGARTVRAVPA